MTTPQTLSFVLACALGSALLGAEPTICGYMGNRSSVYPDAKPTVRWDNRTNVLWKVPVPNLGNGAPVVGGGRVFVLSEPGWKHDFPVISCYDAQSGQLKWEKEIDHLSITVKDEAQRAKIRDAWKKHLAWVRDFYLLYHDWVQQKDSPEVKRRMAEMGVEDWGANYLYGRQDPTKVSEFAMVNFGKKHPEVGKALVGLDTWRCMGSHDMMWMGEVFATPVTDGQAIYVATAWGVCASYDLEGNLRWMQAASPQRPHDYCAVGRSPLLYKDLFITDMGRMVRAYDRATGQLKWEHRREGGVHEFVSPVIFRVEDQDLLWCCGPAAYTLPDGKPLTVEGWKNHGLMVTVNRDKPDTLFFTGGGEHGGWEGKGNTEFVPPAAVRFSLDGTTLKAQVLWCGINGEGRGGASGMVYDNGRLYFASGSILDAETGLIVRGLFGGAVPSSGHQLAIAGGHVYGLRNVADRGAAPAGVMQVHDLEGRVVATNRLHITPFDQLDTDNKTKRLSQWYSWPNATNREWCFTFSASFNIAGDRIYIRSLDDLYCIGNKPSGPTSEPAALAEAALKAQNWAALAQLGPAAKSVAPQIEAMLPKAREPWSLVVCLAAIDPEKAKAHRDYLIKAIVDSRLSDYVVPRAGGALYEMGPLSRSEASQIEAALNRDPFPLGGRKATQQLLAAHYRRSGEVGFTHAWYEPFPWSGPVERGQEVTLNWAAANAKSVKIEPGIGAVEPTGERTVKADKTATYTLTAEGPGGPTARTVTIPVKVAIREFKADPVQVAVGGQVTLRWSTVNADGVTIKDIGKVEPKGEKQVTVARTTEFVIEATGPEGPATQKVKVIVK